MLLSQAKHLKWGWFGVALETWHETFQTIFKKFQENSKDDENQKFFIRKSIIAYMLLFHKMVVFVCHLLKVFEKAIILSPCAFSTIQNKDDLKSVSLFAPEWLNIFTLGDGVGDFLHSGFIWQ